MAGKGLRLTGSIEGTKEMGAAFQRLGTAVRGVLVEAVEAGGEVIRGDAEARAGDTIGMRVSRRTEALTEVEIGPPKEKWYMRFWETGAQSHEITGAPLAFGPGLPEPGVVTGRVDHPGMPARPFMRPAVDNQAEAARLVLGETLLRVIEAVTGGD